jgi:hypothetical protein
MRNDTNPHLTEDQLMFAVIGEAELDETGRAHLHECAVCRAEKELLEARLARLGQLAREFSPVPVRKPLLDAAPVRKPFRLTWNLRPSLGMGLAAVCLLVLVLAFPRHQVGKSADLDKIYQEMVLDQKLLLEIKNLEENPFPVTLLDIPDSSDEDGMDQSKHRNAPAEPEGTVS